MKLWSSIKKELILATRSFYFYIEIMFAVILLAVLLFLIPEHIQAARVEYVFLDMPQKTAELVVENMLLEDTDGKVEAVLLEVGGEKYNARWIEKEEESIYLLESETMVKTLADSQQKTGTVVSMDEDQELHYKYYLQGYETKRLKNLLSVLHNEDSALLEQHFNEQEVRVLSAGIDPLNDKQNAIPPMLAFNSCLMGMFIMAAYVFLDKKEGVIRAYAVTASSVGHYLLSKILVVLLTAIVSCLVVAAPVMKNGIHYGLLLLLLLTSGFFSSVLGLLVASFFKDIAKAFGVIFALLIIMMVPGISYFLPGWNPYWVKLIPSDPIIQGFREIITPNGSMSYVLLASAGFLVIGVVLFLITNIRFKKTLSV